MRTIDVHITGVTTSAITMALLAIEGADMRGEFGAPDRRDLLAPLVNGLRKLRDDAVDQEFDERFGVGFFDGPEDSDAGPHPDPAIATTTDSDRDGGPSSDSRAFTGDSRMPPSVAPDPLRPV